VIATDAVQRKQPADWLRAQGDKRAGPICCRTVDSADKLDLVLLIGVANRYPSVWVCDVCACACAEFLGACPKHCEAPPGTPAAGAGHQGRGRLAMCRADLSASRMHLGSAVSSVAKIASLNNIDSRCQTHIAAAARHLTYIEVDLAAVLSLSVTHKTIVLDKKMPEVTFDQLSMQPTPSVFPLWHILLTAAIAAAVSLVVLFVARRWSTHLSAAGCFGLALVVGASVVLWRAIGNVPMLNDDPLPPFSPNDILCPAITYVCLCVYDGFRRAPDRAFWRRMCAVLVIVSLAVNVIAI